MVYKKKNKEKKKEWCISHYAKATASRVVQK